MPDSGSWDVIYGADSGHTVLGFDFPDVTRREAGLQELATKMGPNYRFMCARPRASRSHPLLTSHEYLDPWIEAIERERLQVVAVLGRRVGGVYAAAVAERISQWQHAPIIILFDPQAASVELLLSEFRREVSATSSLLSDDEITRAAEIAARIAGTEATDIVSAATDITNNYFEISTAAFERAGLGGIYGDKLNEAFAAYMSWISIAGKLDPSHSWKRSAAIFSSDYAEPSADDASRVISQRMAFDVTRAELLGTDCVAGAVRDLLQSHS